MSEIDEHPKGGRRPSPRGKVAVPRLEVVERGANSRAGTLEVLGLRCESIAEVEPQALALTYWLDPGDTGKHYSTAVEFSGRRITPDGKEVRSDNFSIVKPLEVLPGSGPVAITTRVEGVHPGEWRVTAAEIKSRGTRQGRSGRVRRDVRSHATAEGATTYGPMAQSLAPGARMGAWPALVGLGWVVALVVQAVLGSHLSLGRSAPLMLAASIIGLIGAKAYYAAGHFFQGERKVRQLLAGSCIQGFILAAVASLVVGAQVTNISLGTLLDSSGPALMFGMAIGRYGCFFGGCCAGRPTASRWGLWSSNRDVGLRRIPVQLLESTLALVLGLVGFAVAWNTTIAPSGALFVGLLATYTFGRQLLLPLREQSRYTSNGRRFVLAACATLVVVGMTIALTNA